MRRVAIVAIACATISCGPRTPVRVAASVEPDAPTRVDPPSVETAEWPGWEATIPHVSSADVVASPGQRDHVVAGGRRAQRTDEGYRQAPDAFASRILGVAHTTAGWLFLTRDGMLWRTEGFLDAPTAVHRFDLPMSMVGRDHAAILTARGEVFSTDGQAVTRVALPAGRRATSAGHVGADLVVVMDGATPFLRRGNRWTRLTAEPTTDPARSTLVPEDLGLRIFLPDGRAARVPWPAGMTTIIAGLPGLMLHNPADIERPSAMPAGLPADCSVDESPLFVCSEGSDDSYWTVDDGGHALRIGSSPPLPDAEGILSVDRSMLVFTEGGCDGSEDFTICAVDTPSARALTYREVGGFIDAGHGAVVFHGVSTENRLVIGREGRTTTVAFPAEISGPDTSLLNEAVVGGYFFAAALPRGVLEPTNVRGLRVDLDTGRAETFDLPDGAMGIGFLTPQHGVAAGATMQQLWVTDDGGTTWTTFLAHIQGDRASATLVGMDEYACRIAMTVPPEYHFSTERGLAQRLGITSPDDCAGRPGFGGIVCDATACRIHQRLVVGQTGAAPADTRGTIYAATLPDPRTE